MEMLMQTWWLAGEKYRYGYDSSYDGQRKRKKRIIAGEKKIFFKKIPPEIIMDKCDLYMRTQ